MAKNKKNHRYKSISKINSVHSPMHLATKEQSAAEINELCNAASQLGLKGGLHGLKNSHQKESAIAKKAANTRWNKKN